MQRVVIRTTDRGPWDEDLLFVLLSEAGEMVVPSEALGVETLISRLTELRGFIEDAYFDAMRSTDNAEFLCWTATDSEADKEAKPC